MPTPAERISKDIMLFEKNDAEISSKHLDYNQEKIIKLARMYASDSRSFLEKGDLYTAFSCISYAHGLLDAISKLNE